MTRFLQSSKKDYQEKRYHIGNYLDNVTLDKCSIDFTLLARR
jgi:hypothetical protein